jgi:hypothetical protein
VDPAFFSAAKIYDSVKHHVVSMLFTKHNSAAWQGLALEVMPEVVVYFAAAFCD